MKKLIIIVLKFLFLNNILSNIFFYISTFIFSTLFLILNNKKTKENIIDLDLEINKYLIKKPKIKINNSLGKIHTNFRAKKITFLIRISEFNKEFLIAEKKYGNKKYSLNDLDYFKIIKTSFYDISYTCLYFSVFFWLLKISFKYPIASKNLFLNFLNIIRPIKFDKFLSADIKIKNYINSVFVIKNYTHFSYKKIFFKKNFLLNFVNNYNDDYSLRLALIASQNNIANYSVLKKITTKYQSFRNDSKDLPKNLFYGKSFYAFGHLLEFIFTASRSKKNKNIIIMSPSYLSNSCLGEFICEKFKKRCVFDEKIFIEAIVQSRFLQDDCYYGILANTDTTYNISKNDYYNFKKKRSSIDLNILQKIISKKRYKKFIIRDKYICLFNRGSNFKLENFSGYSMNYDRINELDVLIPAINFFVKKNYTVLLMGESGQKINYKNSKFIDYANSSFKNDFNDIDLVKNCNFIVCAGNSGFNLLPWIFKKKTLNLEYPFNRKLGLNNLIFYLIRPMYNFKNRIMKYKDYFNNELFIINDFLTLSNKGYRLGQNSAAKILSCCNKFLYSKFNKNICKKILKDGKAYEYNILN
jgi:putative glycosyltransferase (TIGR04372 family)